jgi:hypothetical protein
MLKKLAIGTILLALAMSATLEPTSAATFVIINGDGPVEGFNDPTPAVPVGGNLGVTVGQQRRNAFTRATTIWGARLTSAVPIRVYAQFNPLTCTATAAVLGSAGPNSFFRDFPGRPIASTWYVSALANARRGADLAPGANDIGAQFNSNVGKPGCLTSSGWYYGYTGPFPAGKLDFITVALHELAHGLGFLSGVNLATGAKLGGLNDANMRLLERHGGAPAGYPAMTNAQRVAANKSITNLHWIGPNVRNASGVLSAGRVGNHVRMYAPNPQRVGSSVSHFDTVLTPNQLMEPNYTVPIHTPVLELRLFRDIGWIVP